MATYFITGTSRGLGLASLKQLLTLPSSEVSKIIATARSPSEDLKSVIAGSQGRVEFVALEVTDEEQIKKAASAASEILGNKGLGVLINNAGIMPLTPGGAPKMSDLKHVFDVDVLSVHNVINAFMPLLEMGSLKKIVNVSTAMASMGLASTYHVTPTPAYKIAKAALNMLTVQWHLAKYEEGFSFFALHPGWLKTDLGGKDWADLEVNVGAAAFIERVLGAGPSDSGKFLNIRVEGWENGKPGKHNYYDGGELPW